MQKLLLRAIAVALAWNVVICAAIHVQSSLVADAQSEEATSGASSQQLERAVSTSIQQYLHKFLLPLQGSAVLTTVALQMSPLPSIMEIRRSKSVIRYDGYPYFTVLAGATQWCIYGAFSAWELNDVTLLTMVAANGPGVVMGLFYVWSYFQHVPSGDLRSSALKRYLQLGCMILCMECSACYLFARSAVFMLGMLGSVGSAQIALSPFKTLPEVISTRSTKSWPLDLCLWNFFQSVATGGFGIANSDAYVWVPNAIGVIATIVQVTFILMFWSSKEAVESSKKCLP